MIKLWLNFAVNRLFQSSKLEHTNFQYSMARIKYYYDTESCRYERITVSTWDVILNSLGFLMVAFLLAAGMTWVYIDYFESPEEALLRKKLNQSEYYGEIQDQQLAEMEKMLLSLESRDDNIYRVIFGVEPVPEQIRSAGVGGSDRYKDLLEDGVDRDSYLMRNSKKIDELKRKMVIQTKSYDEIVKLAKNKEEWLRAMPAIQPVSNKQLKRLSSGFGYRIDPIHKVRRPHNGIDFSLPKGTPVYATADGVVKVVKSSFTGYGKRLDIDHGFGYKTRYAHLDMFNVKKGQKVKRGDLIGFSGNSGKSTAPHLHYEVHKDGKAINPVYYFSRDLTDEEFEEILRLASKENQALGSY